MTGDGEEENIAERGNVGDLTAGISAVRLLTQMID